MFKYEIGERVVVLGNTNKNRHSIGWMMPMDCMRGREYTIMSRSAMVYGDGATYRFEEDPDRWNFDEEWLAPAAQKEVDTAELYAFFNEF